MINDIQQVMAGILSPHFPKGNGRKHNDKGKEMPCLAYKCKFLQKRCFRSEPSGWRARMHFNQSQMVNHRTGSQTLKASTLCPPAAERPPP